MAPTTSSSAWCHVRRCRKTGEGQDEGGEAGWQAWHGGVSRRGWASLIAPPAAPPSSPRRPPNPPPDGQSRARANREKVGTPMPIWRDGGVDGWIVFGGPARAGPGGGGGGRHPPGGGAAGCGRAPAPPPPGAGGPRRGGGGGPPGGGGAQPPGA